MTDEDRRHLAELLRAAWPAGVTWATWYDALAVLERDPAHRTYRALRDTDQRPPEMRQSDCARKPSAERLQDVHRDPASLEGC